MDCEVFKNNNNKNTIESLSLPNTIKPDVRSRMQILEQRRQTMLQLHLSDHYKCVVY